MNAAMKFEVGHKVIFKTANGDKEIGTVAEVLGSGQLSNAVGEEFNVLYLVRQGAYGRVSTFICAHRDLMVTFGTCNYPELPPGELSWSEIDDLNTRAKQMFKALNARGIGGRHHMGHSTGPDHLKEAARKKGTELTGIAWTNPTSSRGFVFARGEFVDVAHAYREGWTQEEAEAERRATEAAVIEEATRAGLYASVSPSCYPGCYISPRYQHEAVNAAEVYAAWAAEQDAKDAKDAKDAQ